VGNPANRDSRVMMVKNFDREEVDFTGEREAGDECMDPVSVSRLTHPSQVVRFASGRPGLSASG
jgi:hypothetical protein